MKIYNDWSWKPTPDVEASISRGERLFREWKKRKTADQQAAWEIRREHYKNGNYSAHAAPIIAHQSAMEGVNEHDNNTFAGIFLESI